MKKLLIILFTIACPLLISAQGTQHEASIKNTVQDKIGALPASGTHIGGYLGDKIDQVISKRIKAQDAGYLVEPFRHKEEEHLWQSEFWGKWIQSAISAYNYTKDPQLLTIIKQAVSGLLETQLTSGYIGNYSEKAQLREWDIWGRKYTLLGLLAYYDLTGDKNVLKSSCRLADNLLSQVGPGKADIVKTGNYRGMPSCSILEPMVLLYKRTGDTKYLEFAKYIVRQWETPDGPKLISKALAGIPVSERFPAPKVWWSWDNGQKAYEMMSCYDGLLELYRITGEPSYLEAVKMAVSDIIKNEINIAGSGSAFECFYKGARFQTEPTYHTMETCVTMTWMKLCFNLLKLTGDPEYADQIEKSAYNALLASLKGDGTQIAKYSPLSGIRSEGEKQCGMDINCCNANGPRAFMMLPSFAVMKGDDGVYINMYGRSESAVTINQSNPVKVQQLSEYPAEPGVEIIINPSMEETFTVALRIPSWSRMTSLKVNGEKITGIIPGSYKKITRLWKANDRISLDLDFSGRVVTQNDCQTILRGPIVLARDTRFADGSVYESASIKQDDGNVELKSSHVRPAGIWMSFTAPLVLGTNLEGEFREARQVNFCDFASAGNTWTEESRYRVWIPVTLNVMKADYKSY